MKNSEQNIYSKQRHGLSNKLKNLSIHKFKIRRSFTDRYLDCTKRNYKTSLPHKIYSQRYRDGGRPQTIKITQNVYYRKTISSENKFQNLGPFKPISIHRILIQPMWKT